MPCKTKSCQSSTEYLRMLRALPPDTPRPPQFQPEFPKTRSPFSISGLKSPAQRARPWGPHGSPWASMENPRMSEIMDFNETHYSVRQNGGSTGSSSIRNMFPLHPVTSKRPESPYGAKYSPNSACTQGFLLIFYRICLEICKNLRPALLPRLAQLIL